MPSAYHFCCWSAHVLACILLLANTHVLAQRQGTQTKESQVMLEWSKCSGAESCTKTSGRLVVDTNWRWTHAVNGSNNCYTGNTWDTKLCPDDKSCAQNCVIDGADYSGTYGVTAEGSSVTMKFVTHGPYSTNMGSRLYLLAPGSSGASSAAASSNTTQGSNSGGNNGGQNSLLPPSTEKYQQFELIGNEFTFDVDVSKVPCGLNTALYFVKMDEDGGQKRFSIPAGAGAGTGYCDAQCARDLKFVGGTPQSADWIPSKTDKNAGVGKRGACCAEVDVWEANSISTQLTLHPGKEAGYHVCEDKTCGGTYSDDRYAGDMDPDGCDYNPFRLGDQSFFGKTVDTSKKMTVVTQFLGSAGKLSEVKRFYVQDGKIIPNAESKVPGIKGNSLTPELCKASKVAFKDEDYFNNRGGFAGVSDAMTGGMTLVLSLWTDHYANLDWLDGVAYPYNRTGPGSARGTCKRELGVPAYVEQNSPDSSVTFSDIRFGPVGSTVKGLSASSSSSSSSTSSTPPSSSLSTNSTSAGTPTIASSPDSVKSQTNSTSGTDTTPGATKTPVNPPSGPGSQKRCKDNASNAL